MQFDKKSVLLYPPDLSAICAVPVFTPMEISPSRAREPVPVVAVVSMQLKRYRAVVSFSVRSPRSALCS